MKFVNNKSAFSLFEMSVVVVIIAILMASVLGGRFLINKSKLAAASLSTKNSPVFAINGLITWYETTTEKSFIASEVVDGGKISTWYDLATNNNATQGSDSYKPIYKAKAISDLPALYFDGASNFMTFNGEKLIGSNYSIFVVEFRTSNKSNNYFIGGNAATANSNLYLGYDNETTITHNQYSNGYTGTTAAYKSYDPKIHSFIHNVFTGKKYYQNGTSIATNADTNSLVDFQGAAIGRMVDGGSSYYYQGYIGEIIIFNNSLSDDQRQDVENYLSQKWKITF